MRVLGIDPGNTTAIAILDDDTLVSTGIIKLGPAKVKKTKVSLGNRLLEYYHGLQDMLRNEELDMVVIEEPYIPHRTASRSMDMKLAIIQLACAEAHIPVVKLVNPTMVKKIVSGQGRIEKQDLAAMLHTKIKNPEAMEDLMEGKRWDETDAIAIALSGRDT